MLRQQSCHGHSASCGATSVVGLSPRVGSGLTSLGLIAVLVLTIPGNTPFMTTPNSALTSRHQYSSVLGEIAAYSGLLQSHLSRASLHTGFLLRVSSTELFRGSTQLVQILCVYSTHQSSPRALETRPVESCHTILTPFDLRQSRDASFLPLDGYWRHKFLSRSSRAAPAVLKRQTAKFWRFPLAEEVWREERRM